MKIKNEAAFDRLAALLAPDAHIYFIAEPSRTGDTSYLRPFIVTPIGLTELTYHYLAAFGIKPTHRTNRDYIRLRGSCGDACSSFIALLTREFAGFTAQPYPYTIL